MRDLGPSFTRQEVVPGLLRDRADAKNGILEKGSLVPAGFSLLEVMVALAILALSLGVIMSGNVNAIASVERIEGMTHATLLARAKMLDLERELNKEGFSIDDEDRDGDFSEQKHPEIKWRAQVKVIKVQTDRIMEMAGSLTEAMGGGSAAGGAPGGPGGAAAGLLGGGMGDLTQLMAPLITPVAQGIGQNMRLVILDVSWPEGKKYRGSFAVTAIVTSKALKQSVQAPSGATGAQGTSGIPGLTGIKAPPPLPLVPR
ncbi:MAG: prepilin-type N-terminal cleavage/methylation domain-containing protein [Deltaproteobacteria bacterium]|nr:prepilin-type N-terminal cleavage/methylation domain-containing protein [Deltaproteobacteria bacterium]